MDLITNRTGVDNLYLPLVELKESLKKVTISGISRMPDPSTFYYQLVAYLEDCFHRFGNSLFIEFYFEYINTGSSKWLYYLVRYLEKLAKANGIIQISWKYDIDDESIEMTGEVLKSQIALPIDLVPIDSLE